MSCHIAFSDVSSSGATFKSTWRTSGVKMDADCQTPKEMYQFSETETQSGIATHVIQDQVKSKHQGLTLLDHYCKLHPALTRDEWKSEISRGKVTVDCEVVTKSDLQLQTDFFLEYVNVSSDKEVRRGCAALYIYRSRSPVPTLSRLSLTNTQTQTVSLDYSRYGAPSSSSRSSARSRSEGKDDTYTEEGDYKGQSDDEEGKDPRGGDGSQHRDLDLALDRMATLVEEEMLQNSTSRAFDGYHLLSSSKGADNDIVYWKCLTVDLEKRKVVFPDWSKAMHSGGRVVRCLLSRNRERMYDIEFDDGGKQLAVREEHIRIVGEVLEPREETKDGWERGGRSGGSDSGRKIIQEGVRVHAKSSARGKVKYLPGRVVKSKAGRYDVECEGGAVQKDLSADDIRVGILEGQGVEARRPARVNLQATAVSWNVTGSTIAASYGRTDIAGWCDAPGAVCVWNVFGKEFTCDNPDYVLDHPSCLLCVAFHPVLPAIVAAGSFNGEVVIWDLASSEQTPLVSPIAEQVHKEPVVDLQWVRDGGENWLLCSAGADGKILFWSLGNAVRNPVMGATLTKGRANRKYVMLQIEAYKNS